MTLTVLRPTVIRKESLLEAVDDLLVFARNRLAKAAVPAAIAARDKLIAESLDAFTADVSGYFAAFAERALPKVRKAVAFSWNPDEAIDWAGEADELGKVLLSWYTRLGAAALDVVGPQLGIQIDPGVKVPGWVTDRVGRAAKNITETTRDTIRDYVTRAVEDGKSIESLTKELADVVTAWGDSGGRAGVIALTESATAWNLSSINGYRDSGLVDEVEILDGLECGFDGHDIEGDNPQADGMIVSLDVAEETPLSHPNCQRSWAPLVAR